MLAQTLIVVALACLVCSGCGSYDLDTAAPYAAGSPAPTVVPPSGMAAASPQSSAAASSNPMMDRGIIEALVAADLARYLNAPIDTVVVASVEERTWPDQGLGCRARRGLGEPLPIPGYLITLRQAGNQYPYHTDKHGNFIRCVRPTKPLGPITR